MIKSEEQIKDLIGQLEKQIINNNKTGKTDNNLAYAMGISVLRWVIDKHDFKQNFHLLWSIEKDPQRWADWWKNWGPRGKGNV